MTSLPPSGVSRGSLYSLLMRTAMMATKYVIDFFCIYYSRLGHFTVYALKKRANLLSKLLLHGHLILSQRNKW